jgi:long-chain-alcohol oxidase
MRPRCETDWCTARELTAKQGAALRLICDTFAPGDGDSVPAASALGALDLVVDLAGRNPRTSERKQLAAVLSLWDLPLMGALGGGGRRRFSAMSQEQRERVLLSYADSRVPRSGRCSRRSRARPC